jgi:hypothetical protein
VVTTVTVRARQTRRFVYITETHRRCACVNTGEELACGVAFRLNYGRRRACAAARHRGSVSAYSHLHHYACSPPPFIYSWFFNDALLGYGLGDPGVRVRNPTGGKACSLLCSGNIGSWVVSENRGVKWEGLKTDHPPPQIVPWLRIVERYLHSSIRRRSVVLNEAHG